MIEPIPGLPDGLLGFTAVGKLHSDDYKDVLIPAIEAKLAAGEQVRVLLVFPTFDGMSSGALWDDLKMGVEHLSSWKRIALVTDIEWMTHLTQLFGWMTPGELKRFPLDQRDEAIAWASAD
jgi:SpoIIAA-like